ncbi:MAG: alcohol dehydrogenase, partial [Rhizobiaceae bacterium]|nr:alcohol dehydrogenase [Rhizobiaceae bacterium]
MLDGLQGHGPRRLALRHRLPQPDPSEILSHEKSEAMSVTLHGTSPRANWSYPTAVKFGAGRISELADHAKAVGMKRP